LKLLGRGVFFVPVGIGWILTVNTSFWSNSFLKSYHKHSSVVWKLKTTERHILRSPILDFGISLPTWGIQYSACIFACLHCGDVISWFDGVQIKKSSNTINEILCCTSRDHECCIKRVMEKVQRGQNVINLASTCFFCTHMSEKEHNQQLILAKLGIFSHVTDWRPVCLQTQKLFAVHSTWHFSFVFVSFFN